MEYALFLPIKLGTNKNILARFIFQLFKNLLYLKKINID